MTNKAVIAVIYEGTTPTSIKTLEGLENEKIDHKMLGVNWRPHGRHSPLFFCVALCRGFSKGKSSNLVDFTKILMDFG